MHITDDSDTAPRHEPVMRERCLELLAPALTDHPGVLIDATLGLGGHAHAALERFPQIRLIGIDRDQQALRHAYSRLGAYSDRFLAVHTTYDRIAEVAKAHGPAGGVDAILMDLGVSSLQLDLDNRGFSYARPAPLDMRMDQSRGVTAAELLATASEAELRDILWKYGEEKFAGRIARAIVKQRDHQQLSTSVELVELIRNAIPAPARRTGGNPAKRSFQALRIAVNAELDILRRALPAALSALRPGGRLVVESYQSLEDKLVKRTFVAGAKESIPLNLPVRAEENEANLKLLTKGAEKASPAEIEENPRAKSVRLRAVEVTAQYRVETPV